jgi:hypothetical protein
LICSSTFANAATVDFLVNVPKVTSFGKSWHRQAKRVVQCGSSELIQAMDAEYLSISAPAKLSQFSKQEQQRILQLPKKVIIAKLQYKQYVTNLPLASSLTISDLDNFLLKSCALYFYCREQLEKGDQHT